MSKLYLFILLLFIFLLFDLFITEITKDNLTYIRPSTVVIEHKEIPIEVPIATPLGLGSKTATWYDYDLPDAPGYSLDHLTAASRDYPRGTCLVVWHILDTDEVREIAVRVNDYIEEPTVDIDLSSLAFSHLAPLEWGKIKVFIEELEGECDPAVLKN